MLKGSTMNEMGKQMELFDEGGLMQEGGTVDPVSGNDVPVGSTQEEVRDDIPAQLSEGEFVMPADVVRYHGLDKMMALRDEAKMGLQRMEDMGQMGNSEEAIIPEDIPFGMDDLEMEDNGEPQEFNVGGVALPGGGAGTQVVVYGPDGTAYGNAAIAQAAGVTNYTMTKPAQIVQPVTVAGTAQTPITAASSKFQPAGTKFTPISTPQAMPTFQETIGRGVPYVNYMPDGFTPTDEAESPVVDTPTPIDAGQDSGGGEGSGIGITSPSVTGNVTGLTTPADTLSSVGGFLTKDVEANANAFGGNRVFGTENPAMRKATLNQAMFQLGSITPAGAIGSNLSKQFGFTKATMNDMAVAGQQGKEAALTTLGFTRASQLQTSEQATMYGTMISAAHEAAKKGEDVTVALAKEINNPAYAEAVKGAAVSALQAVGYTSDNITNQEVVGRVIGSYRAVADAYRDDAAQTKESGTVKDKDGKAVTSRSGVVMTQSARNQMNAELEAAETAEAKANALAAERARQRGNVGRDDGVIGTPTEDDVSAAKEAAEKATQEAFAAGRDYGDEFGNQPDDGGYSVSGGDFSGTSDPSVTATSDTTGQSVTSSYSDIPDELQSQSTDGSSSSSDSKIVCTAMNNAYGFGSFRQAIWLHHSKNMDPAYQKGYHRIFRPLIKIAYMNTKWYNIVVRRMLEGIARRRTADIWMQKKGKRHFVGAVERAILEPVCYIVGKIK